LLTEALRGEGAQLVTADNPAGEGLTTLDTGHPQGSLGPRDVLSRAIFRRQAAGYPVWLDARAVPQSDQRFPTVTRLCAAVGLDPTQNLLPIVPAVHYTMGGVDTDEEGRTGLAGVWAMGETARTGVHGANRLASNSLLECVVWGRAAAASALATPDPAEPLPAPRAEALALGLAAWRLPPLAFAQGLRGRIQAIVSQAAGPIRTAKGLGEGLEALALEQGLWDKAASGGARLADLGFTEVRSILETRNLLLLGPALLHQALARTQSLGAHHRGD